MQIKEQVDDLARQRDEASDEAFGNALDSINQQADALEEELRRRRASVEVRGSASALNGVPKCIAY